MPTLHKRPDLSVIVPVYNLEKFIAPLLSSLKKQDTGAYIIEYVFVLNNCTDNSEAVIRNSGIDCTILNCEEQGCGPSRNAGLEHSTGKYVWFMDGDDWLLSDTAIKTALDKAQGKDIIRIPFKSNAFNRDWFSMVWQYVLRRELIGDTRFPSIQPCEDDAFMEEILAKEGYNRVTYLLIPETEPLYFYNYLREGSNMYRVIVKREKI